MHQSDLYLIGDCNEGGRKPIYRENLRYHLTFLPPPGTIEGKQADELFLLVMDLNYTLRNTTDRPQLFKIRGEFDDLYQAFSTADAGTGEDCFALEVDGRRVKFLEARTDLEGPAATAIPWRGRLLSRLLQRLAAPAGTATTLYINRQRRKSWFSKELKVPAKSTLEVYVRAKEVRRLSDRNSTVVQLQPSVNLFLFISNGYHKRIRSITADLNSRAGNHFVKDHESSYRFEGGILPGQSFDYTWDLTLDPPLAEGGAS